MPLTWQMFMDPVVIPQQHIGFHTKKKKVTLILLHVQSKTILPALSYKKIVLHE